MITRILKYLIIVIILGAGAKFFREAAQLVSSVEILFWEDQIDDEVEKRTFWTSAMSEIIAGLNLNVQVEASAERFSNVAVCIFKNKKN